MSLLSVNDHKNILDFFFYINNDYANFIDRVLTALNDLFGYNVTTYCIFDKDKDGNCVLNDIKSHCINEDVLITYKEQCFQFDLFFQNIDNIRYINQSTHVHTHKVFGENEFFHSQYGQFLAQNKIEYQAILGANKTIQTPYHIIAIFKNKNTGDFTEKELELLSYIGEIFSFSIDKYKTYLSQLEKNEALKLFLDSTEIGFIVINQNMKIIKYNNTFVDYGNSMFNNFDINKIVNNILHIIEEKINLKLNEIDTNIEVKIGKFNVLLRKKITFVSNENFSSLILIQLYKSNDEGDSCEKISKKIIDEFNLTSREVDILNLILEGCNNNEISTNLFISLSTVKSHIRNIFYKMNISSRSEVIKVINNFR
ncbi:LuxR C-terminal-related transcriptional regulator [Romboutsia sp.]|uniref:LuxR C-terminal-related transcriptional regulator n=1 Tax=Romboutsia sp. TaxID=1965302 RepID=UPI003F2A7B76